MSDPVAPRTVPVTIRFTADQLIHLDAHAKAFNMSRSSVVRAAYFSGMKDINNAKKIVSSPLIGPLLQFISDMGPGLVGEEMRSIRRQLKEYADSDAAQQSFSFNNDSELDGGGNPILA